MKKTTPKGKMMRKEWTKATNPPVKVETTTISSHPAKPLTALTTRSLPARAPVEESRVLVEILPAPINHPAKVTEARATEVRVDPMVKGKVRSHDDILLPMQRRKTGMASKKPIGENCPDPKQHQLCDGRERSFLIGRNSPPIDEERTEEGREVRGC